MRFIQFFVALTCAMFCAISSANEVSCEGFLLPDSAPSVDEQELIKQAILDVELSDALNISDEPSSFALQPKDMPHIQWYAGPNFQNSTQVLVPANLPADELKSLADEALRRTTESFQHHLNLSADFVDSLGRPRIRTGVTSEETQKETLAVFNVVMLDGEPDSLESLKVNLVFYKHLHDLLSYTKPQEPTVP